jgi:hypothetical protein
MKKKWEREGGERVIGGWEGGGGGGEGGWRGGGDFRGSG